MHFSVGFVSEFENENADCASCEACLPPQQPEVKQLMRPIKAAAVMKSTTCCWSVSDSRRLIIVSTALLFSSNNSLATRPIPAPRPPRSPPTASVAH